MIENIPIPLVSNEAGVKVLLTAVGVKLPSAFKLLHSVLLSECESFDIDVNSVAPESFRINGQVKFSIQVCESSDALKFLLGLADPLAPHLDFQVVVGAAVAESQKDLIDCAKDFDHTVQSSVSNSVPCLFVFSSSTFDGSQLPECATQIPSNSDENDIKRRVRQGFLSRSMEYIHKISEQCDELLKEKDNPENLAKLASYAFMLGGYSAASEYYSQALKYRQSYKIFSLAYDFATDKNLKIDFDKNSFDRDMPSQLSGLREDNSFPNECASAISYAFKTTNALVQARTLIRIASKVPEYSRPLLHLAADTLRTKKPSSSYYQLVLLLLFHYGHKRTFHFYCDQYINNTKSAPSFLLKAFADVVTSSNDWVEQRVNPAAKLFSSQSVPRVIKNDLMVYLLTYLHRISAEKQKEIIDLIPSNMEIDSKILIDVRSVESIPQNSPINEASVGKSNVFIYSPLQRRSSEKRCAAGDEISFGFQLYNPLSIPLTFDMISLNATNAVVYPVATTIPPKKAIYLALLLKAQDVGNLEVTGFTFVTKNLTGTYKLSKPIVMDVIETLPALVMKQPYRFETQLVENSNVNIAFELINTSNAAVDLKSIKFAPIPPILTPTSLPIAYPPAVNPPLPPSLQPGQSHQFELSFIADHSNTILSFAVEYGKEKYTRRFELNQELTILDGPRISHIQVVSLDDHDDFDTNSVTFMAVISNPFTNPVSVTNNVDETSIVIEPKAFGTFLLNIDRIDINIDPKLKKWSTDGLDSEHIRKCESAAVKAKNAPLTLPEKRIIWSTLLLKKKIGEQLKLQWSTINGLSGSLPFTHAKVSPETLALLQPPPFKVDFQLEKKMENIWELNTKIESNENLKLKAQLYLDLEDIGDRPNCVFTAGSEINFVESPCSFVTAIHCLPYGKLSVVGRFYIGDLKAYFVRKTVFPLE